jgi:serine/threonine protein kinase
VCVCVFCADLKTEKIFVTINEHKEVARCAVGDFDTAKKLNKDTVARTCIGTPSFIAPEVLTARERAGDYNFKADGRFARTVLLCDCDCACD